MMYAFFIYLSIGACLAYSFADIIIMSSKHKSGQLMALSGVIIFLPMVLLVAYPLDYLRTKKPW